MPVSYLPQKLAAFNLWVSNFSTRITASPGTFGLVAGDAVAIAAAYASFVAALAISTANSTRTPVTVQATQTARNSLTVLVRQYVRLILANGGVLDANKTDLGLVIRDTHPSPIPTPGTSPVLALVGATPGELTLTFRDTGSSIKSRSRPAGVASLELHVLFGLTAPASPAATPYLRDVTRSPFAVVCPGGSAGQTAFIYGRWKNAKGNTGPWSTLLSTSVI